MSAPHLSSLHLVAAAAIAIGCVAGPPVAAPDQSEPAHPRPALTEVPADRHSLANPNQVRVRHLGLALEVSFVDRVLAGHVVLAIDRIDRHAPLVVDTRDLTIERVDIGALPAALIEDATAIAEVDASWSSARWRLGSKDDHLGQALTVDLLPTTNVVRVHYRTRPDADGLHWLEASQTGGDHAFLYTQSEAIQARTWIPCQDTPGVRITYDATIAVAAPLRAVMAAASLNGASPYRFLMSEAIPSYLVALAAGDLSFRNLGKRTGIWAQPAVLDAAAAEFADTEKMLTAAEKLFGPYRWQRYDLLVLPPSYPLGGMENPRVTFVTPTILAGDRSLVRLIAHELAHSWSGNLVTNATWSHVWINEGFTCYIERRIVEELYGRERAELGALLGYQALTRELASAKPELQTLALVGEHGAGAGFSSIGYTKGALFLRHLEESYGREVFDPFLASWFSEHAFTSVVSADFADFAAKNLVARHQLLPGRAAVDVDAWLHQPGLVADAPSPQSTSFARISTAAKELVGGITSAELLARQGWSALELQHFLHQLPRHIDAAHLADLDRHFAFTESRNSEVLHAWLVLAVANNYATATPRLRSFLIEVGRYKFVLPLYRALAKSRAGKRWARATYNDARPRYHVRLRQHLDKLLGWRPSR